MLTPSSVHHGQAETVHAARTAVLDAAYAANPDRFLNQPPQPPALPVAAWINKPETEEPDH
jgi:putative transposase